MTTAHYVIMIIGFALWFLAGYKLGEKRGFKNCIKDLKNKFINHEA